MFAHEDSAFAAFDQCSFSSNNGVVLAELILSSSACYITVMDRLFALIDLPYANISRDGYSMDLNKAQYLYIELDIMQ